MSTTTVAPRRHWHTQSSRRPLRVTAGQAFRAAFPEPLPHAHKSSIARARNHDVSNPLHRLAQYWQAQRDCGQPSVGADLCIAYLAGERDRIWGGEPLCFVAESRAEQLADGAEDVAQHRALLEPAAIPAYVEELDQYIARAMRLRRAALMHYEGGE